MGKVIQFPFERSAAQQIVNTYAENQPQLASAWDWLQAEIGALLVPEPVQSDPSNYLFDPELALAPLPDGGAELAWVTVRGVLVDENRADTLRAMARLAAIDRGAGIQRGRLEDRTALTQQLAQATGAYRFTLDSVDYENTRVVEIHRPAEGLDVQVVAGVVATRGLEVATEHYRLATATNCTTIKDMAHMLTTVPGLRGAEIPGQ
jgi:hypothetical protein